MMDKYILLFFIYSFTGWLIETLIVYINTKQLTKRGFLFGPICPIYAIGGLLLILFLNKYNDNLFILGLLSLVICGTVEYIISFLMEIIFHLRWWDYSKRKCNLNGRICLENLLYFSVSGILLIKYINPLVNALINALPYYILQIINLILLFFFVFDFAISLIINFKYKKDGKAINKDSTDEIKKKINSINLL